MDSLYVHIPFCFHKCPYCSFAVSVAQEKRMSRYLECLKKELAASGQKINNTVYIGGGTPSLLKAEEINRLFEILNEYVMLSQLKEITFEMNPDDVEREKVQMLKNWGVTRVSLGVQSMNDNTLQFLGRHHNVETVRHAFALLREEGFKNINLDLIFSIPNQTESELIDDIRALCALKSEHVSLYALTVEKNSRFFATGLKLENDDTQSKYYEIVCKELNAHGFNQYEISNFAKEGAESIHNMNYWLGGDYLGIGMSAHSYVKGRRFWNSSRLTDYMKKIENEKSAIVGEDKQSPNQRLKEMVLIGLRMNRGIEIKPIEKKFGVKCNSEFLNKIDEFVDLQFLEWDNKTLKTTTNGRIVLDEICSRLI